MSDQRAHGSKDTVPSPKASADVPGAQKSTPDGPFARAALSYARRGWAVFPLKAWGKVPIKGTHGHLDASTDREQILKWAQEHEGCNVAIACTRASGVCAADVDNASAWEYLVNLVNAEAQRPLSLNEYDEDLVADLRERYSPPDGSDPAWAWIRWELGLHPLDTVIVETQPGRYQFWFKHPVEDFPCTASKLYKGFDTRGEHAEGEEVKAGYVAAPPSRRKIGGVDTYYQVVYAPVDGELRPAPRALVDALNAYVVSVQSGKATPTGYVWHDPMGRFQRPSDRVPDGQRQEYLKAAAGHYRSFGHDETALKELLWKRFEEDCEPNAPDDPHPIGEKTIGDLAKNYARKASDPVLVKYRELNERYAVSNVSGKVGVFDESRYKTRDEIVLYSPGNFYNWVMEEDVAVVLDAQGNPKEAHVGPSWFKGARFRRKYEGLGFDPAQAPGCRMTDGSYNLWKGFAVKPQRNDELIQPLLDHVLDHIAVGDQYLFDKAMSWFAQIVQDPSTKLGTVLVLSGSSGTGKSIVGDIFRRLLPKSHALAVSHKNEITGSFNGHLSRLLLLQGEEAFWAGDKQAAGTLKHLATADSSTVNEKFVPVFQLPNYIRMMFTSNESWVVPAGMEERRMIVLGLPRHKYINDREYFRRLFPVEKGGEWTHAHDQALLAYLMERDRRLGEPWKVPQTKALTEQKHRSGESWQSFLLEVALEGRLPGDYNGDGKPAYPVLYEAYLEFHKHGHIESRRWLTKRLKTFLLAHGVTDHGIPDHEVLKRVGPQGSQILFPPLPVLRAVLERAYGEGTIDWDEEPADNPTGWHRSDSTYEA